jgi:hypothetical protein
MFQEEVMQHFEGRGVDRTGKVKAGDLCGEQRVQRSDVHHTVSGQGMVGRPAAWSARRRFRPP